MTLSFGWSTKVSVRSTLYWQTTMNTFGETFSTLHIVIEWFIDKLLINLKIQVSHTCSDTGHMFFLLPLSIWTSICKKFAKVPFKTFTSAHQGHISSLFPLKSRLHNSTDVTSLKWLVPYKIFAPNHRLTVKFCWF